MNLLTVIQSKAMEIVKIVHLFVVLSQISPAVLKVLKVLSY